MESIHLNTENFTNSTGHNFHSTLGTSLNQHDEKCTLLNGVFDQLVQVILGVIALSTLFLKRYTERPMRPLRIWGFDASKQLIGAIVAHLANLAIAIILHEWEDKSKTNADECAFYFINFTIDTSFGVLLNWIHLTLLTYVAKKINWTYLSTPGDYGEPIQCCIWFTQLISWVFVILLTKAELAIVIYALQKQLGQLAEVMFSPLAKQPKLELIIVMLICPLIMNCIQIWIQDNFLKKKVKGELVSTKSPKSPQPHLSIEITKFADEDDDGTSTSDEANLSPVAI